MREVLCGQGKFTLDEDDDVVTQYDHEGRVVGIFKATDTPTLRQWIIEKTPVPTGRPLGVEPREKKYCTPRFKP